MKLRERKVSRPAISTASQADIAFLLICFFMLTSTFAIDKGLQIMLPKKGEEVKVKKANIMSVYINALGQIKLGEEEIPIFDVKRKAKQMLAVNDSLIFSLIIDPRCKYHQVVKVFDELRQADALRIAFAPPRTGMEE